MWDEDGPSVDGWWRLVERKRKVAECFKGDRKSAGEAWEACGFAAEFAIKAVIMRRLGMNRWPDAKERPELHSHDLDKLLGLAGISTDDVPSKRRAALKTVLRWRRAHQYKAQLLPRRIAKDMFEATFGDDGVVPWLRSL